MRNVGHDVMIATSSRPREAIFRKRNWLRVSYDCKKDARAMDLLYKPVALPNEQATGKSRKRSRRKTA